MAWYDSDTWSDSDYFESEHQEYADLIFGSESQVDHHAQDLFMEAYFNDDQNAYLELVDYMWDEYQIDWEEVYDWQDFREWYG